MSQEEINKILNGQTPQGGAPEPPAAEPPAEAGGGIESTALSQDDIDAMLNGQSPDNSTAVEPPAAPAPAAPAGELNQADIDAMMGGGGAPSPEPAPTELNQDDLNNMLADAGIEPDPPAPAGPKVEVGDFSFGQIEQSAQVARTSAPPEKLDMIMDISVQVSVELGRTRMPIKDLLSLVPGSVVELDKLAGDPLDIFVNDSLVAKGKVVVVDENFGIRITDLVSKEDRIRTLK